MLRITSAERCLDTPDWRLNNGALMFIDGF
jgi:hypothetical protein